MSSPTDYEGGIPVDASTLPNRGLVNRIRVGLAQHAVQVAEREKNVAPEQAAITSPIESMGPVGAE